MKWHFEDFIYRSIDVVTTLADKEGMYNYYDKRLPYI